jgi:hypothetical protein
MQPRKQDYPYSLKTVTAVGQSLCNNRTYFKLYPPQELLRHKSIHVTVIIVFDVSVPAPARVVRAIGIGNEWPFFATLNPSVYKRLALNKVADVNRRVEIQIDLTPLILPASDNWVVLELDDSLLNTSNIGIMKLWKIDELYTTTGIR